MDIIDVSPDDLVLPGDCLGGAVLRGWHGPVVYDHGRALVRGTVGDRLYLCHNTGPEHPPAVAFGDVGLPCTLPAFRDHLRRVLAAGERCVECDPGFPGAIPLLSCACNGTGYTRQPHDLGSFIDAEIAGRITPRVAAGLMWASVLRVGAGLGPVTYVNGAEDRRRRSPTMSDVSALLDNGHILLPLPDRIARLRLED